MSTMETIAVIVWILFGTASAIVAVNRGESGCLWFFLGVLLGPIGLILAFMGGRKCPDCASRISKEAKVCPKCRARLADIEESPKGVLSEIEFRTGVKKLLAFIVSMTGGVFLTVGLIADLGPEPSDSGGDRIFSILGLSGFFLSIGCVIAIIRAMCARKTGFGWLFLMMAVGLGLLLTGVLAAEDSHDEIYTFLMGYGLLLSGFIIATMRAVEPRAETTLAEEEGSGAEA